MHRYLVWYLAMTLLFEMKYDWYLLCHLIFIENTDLSPRVQERLFFTLASIV